MTKDAPATAPSKTTIHLHAHNGDEIAQWLIIGKGLPTVVFWSVHGGQRFFALDTATFARDGGPLYYECDAPVEIGRL